jgi:hemoglobin/transferrin/lactoferrin receptor protein
MKKVFLLFILELSLFNFVLPQTVIIIDKEGQKPVSDVVIHNRQNSIMIYSNSSGKAEISAFDKNDIICFRHFSYENICLSTDEIEKADNKIFLTRKVFPIEEFVVSATRWEQKRNEVPNRILSLPAPSVRFQNPQTTADIISMSGEVFVQKSQLGGGSPMIRGFATNRLLIVIDGVRLNNAIYREGNIQNVISLDPNTIESGEIIFGPGASSYGSDAIGGVMDFHTKKALFSAGDKPYFKAEAMTRYSTADKEKTAHLDFNLGAKRIALLSSISYSDFDDLKMGSGKFPGYLRPEYVKRINGKDSVIVNSDPKVQVYSGYSQINTMNKLRLNLAKGIDLVYSNHYSALSDVPRYDRLIQYKSGKLRYGDWYYGPQVWMLNNLQVTISKPVKLFDELRIIAANQNYKESRHDRSLGKSIVNEQFEKVKIISFNLDFDKKLSDGKSLLYYGFEFVNNDIKSIAQTKDIDTDVITPAGSRYPNGTNKYNNLSAYAGYKNNLSEKLTLITGLRYSFVTLNSTIADNHYYNFPFTRISISNGALTGSAGMVYRPDGKTQMNFNASTGFRAPNLDDAGKVFDSAPGMVVVPNPGLKPEYSYNFDLGISRDFAEFIHLDVTGFFTWLNNAMVRHDFIFNGQDSILYGGELSKVEAIVNAGYARVYGVSLNLQANISHYFSFKTTLNITEGKEKGGVPLRHATPVFGSSRFVYETSKFKADLYALYNGARKFRNMAPSEIAKPYMYATDKDGNPWCPGWFTLNFKASYSFSKWGTVNAGIENILDYRYRPYSSGIVAPGRNFIISFRVAV